MIILRFEPPAPLHFIAGRPQSTQFGLRVRAARACAGKSNPDQVVEVDFHSESLLDQMSQFQSDGATF